MRLKYVPALDGVRCLAVTLVVLHHTVPAFWWGWIGVDVFFVLSGFLITSILAAGPIDLGTFYLKRVLRLAPALAVLLAVYAVVALLAFRTTLRDHMLAVAFSATYLMNWASPFGWAPGTGRGLGHAWSLAAEEQFYLLWPLVLMMCRSWLLPAALTLACLFGAAFSGWIGPFHAAAILAGCAIALSPPATMAVARIGAPLVPFLSLPPLVYLGRISYGIYLWHYPLAVFLGNRYGPLANLAVTSAASVAIAAFSYRFVETPFLRLKDHIDRPRRPALDFSPPRVRAVWIKQGEAK